MDADLGDVRVHTGGEAGRLNRDLNARAFAEGRDIYFAEGKYDPESDDGRRLLAHELAHVVQQSGGGAPEAIQREPDKSEKSAPRQDPQWEVMGLMDDPLWALDGRAFRVLNGLEMSHLLHTLQALRGGGHLTRLLMSVGAAKGIDRNRLETAMRAVAAKGMKTTPDAFALAHRAQLEMLNLDQRLAVLRYLGPVPSEPLGEVVKVRDIVYVVVENEVRFGAEGDKTKTWRTNNPGALTVPQAGEPVSRREKKVKEALLGQLRGRAYADTSNPHGYKYDEYEGGARLAVFPTESKGRAALRDKLKAFQDGGATLKGFGASQLGAVEAGEGYAQLMVELLRNRMNSPYRTITVETRMSRIDLDDLVEVTQRREGWNPEDKGRLVPWADTARLEELPAPVQFRVLLARWNLEGKKK